MIDEVARRSHAVFRKAMEVECSQRDAFVESACAGDRALRARVLALIGALAKSDAFLEAPALNHATASPRNAHQHVPMVERIGGFQIIGIIGSGGMATVYEAMQDKPRRRVALKVMKHGLSRTVAMRRFEFEAEALARLQHPGIARIYEIGTHRDAHGASIPFFAMEYIADAQPMTQYSDLHRLDPRARLAMLAEVCDAVQHGHECGIIHRDLKPPNILVDGAGAARVIDFGIARSTDPEQAIITQDTGVGQVIGTLHYMSPEQCAGSGAIDVRTDVYALGIILYELLCGRLPHDLTHVPLPEAIRIVQQDQPLRPNAVDPSVRGDLEAIVLKAIDRDPGRRYRSVANLASDIRRYLRHEAIEARPPTLVYQCRLFARRHRALVVAMIAITLTMIVATFISTSLAIWALAESSRRAEAEEIANTQRDAALWRAYTANVAAAIASHDSGEFRAMRTRLERAPAGHRGWEWRLLDALSRPELQSVDAHESLITDMAISDDGALLATAAFDGSIAIWNARTRSRIAGCGGDDVVTCIAFSPDGLWLASGVETGAVRLWSARTGAAVREFNAGESRIERLAWLNDHEIIVTTQAGALTRWSAHDARLVAALDDQPGGIHGVALSADRAHLLTWNTTGSVWLREATTWQPIDEFAFDGEVECAAISAEGVMAAGGLGGRISMYCSNQAQPRELKVPDSESLVRTLAFAPDGSMLVAGLGDRTIMGWSVETAQPAFRRAGHDDAVSKLLFSPDGAELLSSSFDRTIRVWSANDASSAETIATLAGHAGRVISIAFSPDGAMLASASTDHTVRLWDPELREPIGVLEGHDDFVFDVAFDPLGRYLASASYDDTVRVWDAWTGEPVHVFDHGADVWTVAFSPDGRHIASGGDDRVVTLRDVESGATVMTLPRHSGRVISVAYSPDGTMIASTSRDHDVILWDARTGEPLHVLPGHRLDVFCCAFSADGLLLYTGSRDQSVRIWNTRTGACEDVLEGHGQWITGLALSADGSRLAGSSWFGKIVLWDVPTGEIVASFESHSEVVRAIAFDPQGRRMASASYDGSIRLHDEYPRARRQQALEAASAARDQARRTVSLLRNDHPDFASLAAAIQADERLSDEACGWLRKALLQERLAAR